MAEPIAVRVVRYRCPHCARSHSSRSRATEHMGRCWRNPDARGCKTCKHFEVDSGYGESCAVGVDLSGRPACDTCDGFGYDPAIGWDDGVACPTCGGDPDEIKPGPIVGCEKWEAAQ